VLSLFKGWNTSVEGCLHPSGYAGEQFRLGRVDSDFLYRFYMNPEENTGWFVYQISQ
jgi:hypothetical protein